MKAENWFQIRIVGVTEKEGEGKQVPSPSFEPRGQARSANLTGPRQSRTPAQLDCCF